MAWHDLIDVRVVYCQDNRSGTLPVVNRYRQLDPRSSLLNYKQRTSHVRHVITVGHGTAH